jgi:hypothetical protein
LIVISPRVGGEMPGHHKLPGAEKNPFPQISQFQSHGSRTVTQRNALLPQFITNLYLSCFEWTTLWRRAVTYRAASISLTSRSDACIPRRAAPLSKCGETLFIARYFQELRSCAVISATLLARGHYSAAYKAIDIRRSRHMV